MKQRQNKSGYSLIELVLVMMLLVAVASLIFTLTATGSQAWMRLNDASNDRLAMRTAMSYLDVQLKKSDNWQTISVEPNPFNGEDAIKIMRKIKNPTIPDMDHSILWIYADDGYLHELVTMPGIVLTDSRTAGRPLVEIDAWQIDVISDHLLEVTVRGKGSDKVDDDNTAASMTRRFNLKAGGLFHE